MGLFVEDDAKMSDVETADDGAQVAPVDDAASEQPIEQDQAQDSTTEQVETQQDDKPRDDKGRFVPQERVNEITRARREAERRAEALERELSNLRQQQPAQNQPQSKQDAPKLEDYDYDMSAFGAALTEYAVTQAQTQAESRIQQRTQQEQAQKLQRSFEDRAAKYAAEHPEFDEAVSSLTKTVQFRPEVVETISASEHGPAVVHYLAQHLNEADDIARMPAHLAAAQIGRIESRLSATKPKPVTNAPTPTPSLGGGSVAKKDLAKLSYADYRRERMKGAG